MLDDALVYLLQTLGGFFAGTLLLRFWMQWCRAPIRNPLWGFVQALTNFAVLPARRFIPGLWGMDLATLILAWLVLMVEAVLTLAVKGIAPGAGLVLLMALVMLIRLAVYLAIGSLVLLVIISWVNPESPMYSLVNMLTRPMLRPIQRVIPAVGMIDLSPLIALVLLQLILMLPLAYLERLLAAASRLG